MRALRHRLFASAIPFLAAFTLAPSLPAHADWHNAGGNVGRNGLTTAIGPTAPDERWSGGASSIIAWQPVIEGNRMFVVRQTGFPPPPPGGEPNGSPVIAYDVTTGAFLWDYDVPFNSGDWTTWIAGVKNGRVYASRSGNGASVTAKMHCLDAATGDFIWESQEGTNAGAYDGVVFADNGDLIVGSFTYIKRIRAVDGTTAWTAPRVGSVSGNCGVAINEAAGAGGAVYAADAVFGGHVIKRFNLTTGAFEYQSPVLPGFTLQQSPTVSTDGTIYLARTQSNPAVDFFYAFDDTGSAITIRWNVAAGWSTSSEFGVGNDGSIYMRAPGNVIERRAAADGALIDFSDPLVVDASNSTWRFAIDGEGKVFVNNGSFANGRLYSFNGDLTQRWFVPITNINIGGPAIASDGTLIVVGNSTIIKAYYTPGVKGCVGDVNASGAVDVDDLIAVILGWGACDRPCPPACAQDTNADCAVDVDDLVAVILGWGDCP
jgi:hypothetical protein